jgi:hypothetical protein
MGIYQMHVVAPSGHVVARTIDQDKGSYSLDKLDQLIGETHPSYAETLCQYIPIEILNTISLL